ncbi:MAG: lipoyl synthase [Candidatus Omnitrophica bacterium]|nr:lipoyl synthase [Candidatus Omnitrophota bacterium]
MSNKTRPAWLEKKINLRDCSSMKSLLRGLALNTVCEEAACPNISECFGRGIATFMILGKNCTRKCRFCNIGKEKPSEPDSLEPYNIAEAVAHLKLRHIVITSVTRDDLPDGGSGHFAGTIKAIRKTACKASIEVLIPDFKADIDAIKKITDAAPDIINHNVETVPRFYPEIRPEAGYKRSLDVLRTAKALSADKIYTKSGIMLGFGETVEEVLSVLNDLSQARCDLLSIGQYLAPSRAHYPVKEYIKPEIFDYYREKALMLGFKFVKSSPYTRSSYLADEYLSKAAAPR